MPGATSIILRSRREPLENLAGPAVDEPSGGGIIGIPMKALILFVCWCILLVLYWPLALLALVLFPVVWLISLPLRIVAMTVHALFALLRAVLCLPAQLFGGA